MPANTPVINKTPKLFGAYVTSVNLSLSWGSQGSSVQFTLVEDPDNKDENGQPDPVIADIPAPGTPVIFPEKEYDQNGNLVSFGTFNFDNPLAGGFLQRWSYDESLSGRTFNVVLQSPATIFDGVQVILNNFDGHASGGLLTNEVDNLLNVYGHYENFLVGGNYGQMGQGGFGDSAVDELGFPIFALNEDNEQVNLFDTLVKMTIDPNYSNFGNPIKNGSYENDNGEIVPWEYQLDFTELYDVIVAKNIGYYRIGGNVRDLSSMISEICDLVQYDWLIELLPDPADVRPILKLRLIDRSFRPTAGVLSSFLVEARNNTGSAYYGSVVSVSYGQELTKATTAKVVVGGPISRWLDMPLESSTPLWGRGDGKKFWTMQAIEASDAGRFKKSTDVYTQDKLLDPQFSFPIDIAVTPNPTLIDPWAGHEVGQLTGGPLGRQGQYYTTLMELRILTGKNPEKTWSLFKMFQVVAGVEPNGWRIKDLPDFPFYAELQVDEQLIIQLAKSNRKRFPAQQLQQTRLKQQVARQNERKVEEFDSFFKSLRRIADESFCRQFMVRVPMDLEEFRFSLGISNQQLERENIRFINTFGDQNVEQYERSWQITSDAWALNPQVGRADFFNDGRLKGLVGFKRELEEGDWGGKIPPGPNDPPPKPCPPFANCSVERGVYVDDMGDHWTYTSGFSTENYNNTVPLHPTSPTRALVPNPAIAPALRYLNLNPQGAGTGAKTLLDLANPRILSWDGGPLENEIYSIPDTTGPNLWVACGTTVNPIVVDELTTPYYGFAVLAKYFFDIDMNIDIFNNPSNESLLYEIPPLRVIPEGFGVPQESNKYRYGPYVKSVKSPGNTGKTQVEFDDNLLPETYGSYSSMDRAGFALSEIDIGRVEPDETGFLELAGTPEYNLGQQFLNAGPYITNMDVKVGIDGVKTTYKFDTWTPSFGKLAKFNIDLLARTGKSSFNNALSPATAAFPVFDKILNTPLSPAEKRRQEFTSKFGASNEAMFRQFLEIVDTD